MYDAVVIGGGPAGSSVSALLARLGYRILLLEKEHFPRHHIGESTLPATLEVLETIGVLNEVHAAGFPIKRGGVYVWGKSREPWLFRFGELNIDTALQVERARFDQILLDHARRLGVDVREEHQVTDALEEDGRLCGVRYIDAGGRRHNARARWVLDASGQSAFLAHRRRTRQINEDLKNVAIYGYWYGPRAANIEDFCAQASAEDRNSIFIETTPAGWCWWIPLGETYFSVGAIAGREEEGVRHAY